MFEFFGKLFSSSSSLDKIVGSVSSGLDSLVHTDQEKAEEASKERTEARQMVVSWMQSTSGQNISRRFIAISFTLVFLFQKILTSILSIAAIWLDDAAKFTASAAVIDEATDGMTGAIMLILSFYFAAPHMSEITKVAMERFSRGSSTSAAKKEKESI